MASPQWGGLPSLTNEHVSRHSHQAALGSNLGNGRVTMRLPFFLLRGAPLIVMVSVSVTVHRTQRAYRRQLSCTCGSGLWRTTQQLLRANATQQRTQNHASQPLAYPSTTYHRSQPMCKSPQRPLRCWCWRCSVGALPAQPVGCVDVNDMARRGEP